MCIFIKISVNLVPKIRFYCRCEPWLIGGRVSRVVLIHLATIKYHETYDWEGVLVLSVPGRSEPVQAGPDRSRPVLAVPGRSLQFQAGPSRTWQVLVGPYMFRTVQASPGRSWPVQTGSDAAHKKPILIFSWSPPFTLSHIFVPSISRYFLCWIVS